MSDTRPRVVVTVEYEEVPGCNPDLIDTHIFDAEEGQDPDDLLREINRLVYIGLYETELNTEDDGEIAG